MDKLRNVDSDEAVLRTFILFVQTAQVVLKYVNANLYRKTRLSAIKLIVLRVLASNNGVMTPSYLAEWTQTERHNITALVGRMKREGLVTTGRNSSDKRLLDVILTDKGREVLNQAMPVAGEIVNYVMSSLIEADTVPFEKTLGILRQNAHNGLEGIADRNQPQPK